MALFFLNNSSKDDVRNVVKNINLHTQDTLVEDALACNEAPHDTETFEYFVPWEIDPTPNNGLEATPGLFVPTYAEGNNPHFDCNGMLEISNSKAIDADNVQGIGCPLPSIDISWNASDSDPDVIRESPSSTFESLDDSQVANWPLMSTDDNETNLTFDIDAYLEGWWEESSANGDSSTFVVNAGPESSDPKSKGTDDSQVTFNILGNNSECATFSGALSKDDDAWIERNCYTNKPANPPQHRESSTSSVASSSDAKTGDLPQVSLAALPQVDRAIEEDVTSPARLSEDGKPQDVFVTDAGHIKELVSSEFDQHDATNNTVETQRAEDERSSFRDSLGPEVSTVSSPASELAREDITKDPNSGIMQPINVLSSDGDVERPQRHPRVRVIDLTKDDDGMPPPIQECCPPSTGSKHDTANTLSSNYSPVSKRGKKRQSPPGFEEWGSSEFQEKVIEGFRSAFLDVNSLWWGMEVALMRKIREYDDHHYQVMPVFLAFRVTWSNMFGKYKGKTLTPNDILELRSCWNDTIEILKKEMPLDNVDSSEDVDAFNQALTILTDQAALRDCLDSYADGQQEDDDSDFIAHPHKIRRSSKNKRPKTKSRRIRWNGIAV